MRKLSYQFLLGAVVILATLIHDICALSRVEDWSNRRPNFTSPQNSWLNSWQNPAGSVGNNWANNHNPTKYDGSSSKNPYASQYPLPNTGGNSGWQTQPSNNPTNNANWNIHGHQVQAPNATRNDFTTPTPNTWHRNSLPQNYPGTKQWANIPYAHQNNTNNMGVITNVPTTTQRNAAAWHQQQQPTKYPGFMPANNSTNINWRQPYQHPSAPNYPGGNAANYNRQPASAFVQPSTNNTWYRPAGSPVITTTPPSVGFGSRFSDNSPTNWHLNSTRQLPTPHTYPQHPQQPHTYPQHPQQPHTYPQHPQQPHTYPQHPQQPHTYPQHPQQPHTYPQHPQYPSIKPQIQPVPHPQPPASQPQSSQTNSDKTPLAPIGNNQWNSQDNNNRGTGAQLAPLNDQWNPNNPAALSYGSGGAQFNPSSSNDRNQPGSYSSLAPSGQQSGQQIGGNRLYPNLFAN